MEYSRRNHEIETLYRSGQTMAEIGERFAISRGRVQQILCRAGSTRDDGGASVRTQRRADAIDALMAETGMSQSAAARVLGIPSSKVIAPSVTREERRVLRFWRRVDSSGGENACWPYTGGRCSNGYGHTAHALPGSGYAHRCAFALTHNVTLSTKDVIRHSCDNPPCCNPRHLLRGTQAENIREREERSDWRRRPKHIRHEDVLALRRSGMTQVAIAAHFGCSQSNICQLLQRLRKTPLA